MREQIWVLVFDGVLVQIDVQVVCVLVGCMWTVWRAWEHLRVIQPGQLSETYNKRNRQSA